MKRLLLTGASGFLGWNIGHYWANNQEKNWNIIGTYLRNSANIDYDIQGYSLDITDELAIDRLFDTFQFDGIIHAAALSSPNNCAKSPELSYQINVKGTKYLAKKAKNLNIPMIFTSSSQIFDGDHAPYSETDSPNPISVYAEHKLAAEQAAFAVNQNIIIVRMPLMYGITKGTTTNFFREWLVKMKNNRPLFVFTDEIRTLVSGQEGAAVLFQLLESGIQGELFHLSGDERLSRADFAFKMAEIFEIKNANIIPCLQKDKIMNAKRPKDLSLTIQKLQKAIDFQPKSIDAGLRAILNT